MGDLFGSGPHGEADLQQYMERSGRDLSMLSREQYDCIFRRCKRLDIEEERLDVGVGENSAIGWHADVFGIVALGDFGCGIEN